MADKSVGELIAAKSVTPTDLFVLEQNGTAKKLTGQILENWLVSFADGHGGIQSIAKLSTSGLVDTYRITLADTTTFDFNVNNGKSITGISKTGASGLVDTYKISYNDGSSQTYTVTNGAKGDKGDNAYVWIKYASQEPTESSNSMGDIPDDWIGIYSGNASTAPTDWKQYKWFQIKGEKGNTGEAATLATKSVTYQVGDSGIIIPSGSWGSSIPVVSQGKYLWTKTEVRFNTGDPIISYSVARMGIDGSGSVSSVAGVSPDATGNVQLTPDDIGADTKKKYGKLVVFGDSLGQGVNNDNYSFVDILSESGAFDSVVKACAGGATIGPYQTYEGAINYDLNSQVERYISDVRDADIIICEYCGNDLISMMSGNTKMGTSSDSASATTICGYTKKALNRIYELNPDVVIQWVHFGETNYDVIKQSGGFMLEAGGGTADPWLLFAAEALRVVKSYGCKLLKINFWSHDGHVSNDVVHPNAAGQQYIANAIMNNLFCDMDIGHIKRPLTITGDITSNTNLAIDGNFDMILALLASGVDVPLSYGAMQFNLVVHTPDIIGFNFINDAGLLVNVAWHPDGNLAAYSVNLT